MVLGVVIDVVLCFVFVSKLIYGGGECGREGVFYGGVGFGVGGMWMIR